MNKVLYISLTGMTEPLGRSQVLEYLIDLSKKNKFYLISFEREQDLVNLSEINILMQENNIEWHYFIYSNRYGVFSTVHQFYLTIKKSSILINKYNIDIIHARSFIPAVMGYILKKIYNIKLLFDVRGFSSEEKVDRNRLKKNSFIYKIHLNLEKYLFSKVDHLSTLTDSFKTYLIEKFNYKNDNISVIPTCSNKKLFKNLTEKEKINFRKELGFSESDIILIHTGTILNRYDFEKELQLFKLLNKKNENFKFIILNKGEHEIIKNFMIKLNINDNCYLVTETHFINVYKYLNISDFSIFIIPPTIAKIAMAPTKFAENIACYLPSITNSGVGDLKKFIENYKVGYLIDYNSFEKDLDYNTDNIIKYYFDNTLDKKDFDKLFYEHFDKKQAVIRYQKIYDKLVES